MGKQQEEFFNLAVEYFEAEEYEQSVIYFITAYNLGYQREKILEILYTCFITPNEDEFKANYKENCIEMAQFPYDKLALDFIPVADDKFYIFDREKQEFNGMFELEEEPIRGEEVEFHSILYTDSWDIREMLPVLKERDWETVYILMEGIETRFLSFFKLPKFKEKYLENAVVFKNCEYMYLFFERYEEFYLPKELVSQEPEKYLNIIKRLQYKRIYCPQKKRENIFLSICIPSYNRGKIALENVLHILKCPYDSEIEVIVSNNGSVKGVEEYRKIGKLTDSRVHYYEFEQNQGYATNVLKTLELAKGKFAVITSDEDLVILEHLREYLSCLKANRTVGVFWEKVMVSNTYWYWTEKNKVYQAGFEAVREAISLNYITGITYNMDLLRESNVFCVVAGIRGNYFLEAYVHMVLAAIAGKYGGAFFIDVLLWNGGEQKGENHDDGQGFKDYMLPQNRIHQLKSLMEFLDSQIGMEKNEFEQLFFEQSQKVYNMLLLAYKSFEDYRKSYIWEEICSYIYREEMKYLDIFPFIINEKEKEILVEQLKNLFLNYLEWKEMFYGIESEEIQRKKLIHQIIRMELEGNGKKAIKVSIKDDLCLNINLSLEGVINRGEHMVEEAGLRKAVSEGRLIQYVFEECWNRRKDEAMEMKSWDA